jgi:hypothetical protein
MSGPTWSRRRFLTAAGAGGLGLLSLPALTAAKAQHRPLTRQAASPDLWSTARFGCFSEPLPPEHGFMNSLEAFEADCGRTIDVYRSYRNWGQALDSPTITHLLKRTPPPRLYFSVHAFYDSKAHNVIQWSDITAGVYDSIIDSYASQLMGITAVTPVYLCFHHEMENEEGKCGTADEFQAAYWYFRNRIQIVNAVPNLTWVVTYMGNTFRGKHGGPERWWPTESPYPSLGPDQLMGVDLYNRNKCHSKLWREFDWLAEKPWQFATDVGRPLFIGESGSVELSDCDGPDEDPPGTMKGQWFDNALVYMRDTGPSLGYSPLEAFCYSNVKGFNDGSYRIDTSQIALEHFQSFAIDPFFALP